jgi:hypothetical protein
MEVLNVYIGVKQEYVLEVVDQKELNLSKLDTNVVKPKRVLLLHKLVKTGHKHVKINNL